MKRVWNHPPEKSDGRKYWRSLGELENTPEFRSWLEREFPAGAAELAGNDLTRRSFLRLMGASTALAGFGLASCRRPEAHLVPFTESVEWSIPGKSLFYATAMPRTAGALPLIVETVDGRPIKIEGNPLHPASGGGTDAYAQASVIDLYDPDRSKEWLHRGTMRDAAAFAQYLTELHGRAATDGGKGLAFLLDEVVSPTRERLRDEILRRYPAATWAVYSPLGSEEETAAASTAFSAGVRLVPRLENADVILSLDSDFLSCEFAGIEPVRAFSRGRRAASPQDRMNRLYVIEPRYTVTGGMAEHRLRARASEIANHAEALVRLTVEMTAASDLAGLVASASRGPDAADRWLTECARDLTTARGRSLVIAGSRQPARVHLLAHAMNAALGNLGKTTVALPEFSKPAASLIELATKMRAGEISDLIILGGNPVYNAPVDLAWGALQKSVPHVTHLSDYVDATSLLSEWHIPAAHFLESWGDSRAPDGSLLAIQPMILPLWGGISQLEVLAGFLDGFEPPESAPPFPPIVRQGVHVPLPDPPPVLKEVRQTFELLTKPAAGEADAAWREFLRSGFAKDTAPAASFASFNAAAVAAELRTRRDQDLTVMTSRDDSFEVVFPGDYTMYDGRYINNGWLQETPDPVTKLTWDNAALLSAATATKIGVRNGELMDVNVAGRTLRVPALIVPGHADGTIAIALGYGQDGSGAIGDLSGFNAYQLRTTAAPYFATGATARATGEKYALAVTQEHWSMEGRALVREGTLAQFREQPDFAKHMVHEGEQPDISLYSHPPLNAPHQWAMTIDLNTCTGCNACVVACQAENNVPIVGKKQVIMGREMHWLRLDRYFVSTDPQDAAPQMVTQPMLCQHCENAPCEPVCPVNATVHSVEGLNVMVYNRCIGTRYCANNCPYKVRRFNFFDYNKRRLDKLELGPFGPSGMPESLQLQKNPNVTVRMRGVMEKCTFCVQRIQSAKIKQKVIAGASDNIKIPTDSFQSACQQACPSEAIVFGDIADPYSSVSKIKANPRNYSLLAYLNTQPRVTYLARLRNPNMQMPDADKMPANSETGYQGPSADVREVYEGEGQWQPPMSGGGS